MKSGLVVVMINTYRLVHSSQPYLNKDAIVMSIIEWNRGISMGECNMRSI